MPTRNLSNINPKSTENRSTIHQTSIENQSKIDERSSKNPSNIDQNRGLEGVWADSGSQVRLRRRPGRFMGDFIGLEGPKMASNQGPDRTNIDANIDRIFDAFANRNFDGQKLIFGWKNIVFWTSFGMNF